METINTMLVMDIIIAILGMYLMFTANKMKKTKKIDRFIVAEETMRLCKDEASFTEYLSKRMLIFAAVLTISGLVMAIHETFFDLGYGFYVVVTITVVGFLWFYKSLTDGRDKFC